MPGPKHALLRRGAAALAVAAVVAGSAIGSTLAAGSAFAATETIAAPSPAASPGPATTSPTSTAAPPTSTETDTEAPLPAGLAEAVKRDLGMSVEQFDAAGEVARQTPAVQAEATNDYPSAGVVAKDGQAAATASPPTAEAVQKASQAPGTATVTATETRPAAKPRASGVDQLFKDYVARFGIGKLQSIMVNGAGTYVVRTAEGTAGSAPLGASLREAATPADHFAAAYSNVTVEDASGPAPAKADVVGGQGYVSSMPDRMFEACTLGWNAFNKSGAPAAISAGHCTQDGSQTTTYLTDPTIDQAGSGTSQGVAPTGELGTFGFSQFGGPNNSPVAAWDPATPRADLGDIGTDVSVIDGINGSLKLLPMVTDWSTPAFLASSGPKVANVADAVVGTPICKSGRTTGWTCATVSEIGVFVVQGINFPSEDDAKGDPKGEPNDVRAVRGFGAVGLVVGPGDSGGPVIAGTSAVGITSAGGVVKEGPDAGKFIAYATSLTDALRHTDGYTVKVSVNAPKLKTSAVRGAVYRGGTVTGTVKDATPGTVVTATVDGKSTTQALNARGEWTLKAPNTLGAFTVTAQAKNGFSTSAKATFTLTVVKKTLPTPATTAPSDGATVTAPVRAIMGKGQVMPASVEPAPTQQPATTTPVVSESTGELANTGVSAGILPLGTAGGALLVGGTTTLLIRRRYVDG